MSPRVVRRRAGYTLVELLIALTLLGAALAAATGVVMGQWRLHASLDGRRGAQAQLDAALDALRSTLATLDTADVVAAADSMLELRATSGASVVCGVVGAGTIELPPASLDAPARSWWASPPSAGDELLVHDGVADRWLRATIDAAGSSITGCAGSPLLGASDAGRARLRVRFSPPHDVAVGAPVRLLRRVRWQLYRASDGRSYLGQREWDGAAWSVVQPVAGPLRGTGARAGVTFTARDSAGTALGSWPSGASSSLRAIDVVLRVDVPRAGDGRGATQTDSIRLRAAVVASR